MKKKHPDVSPELNRLASIVNEAKEVLSKAEEVVEESAEEVATEEPAEETAQ